MKNNLKYILGFLLAVLLCIGVYSIASIYNLKILKDNIDYAVINKNMKNAFGITMDDEKNIYVAKSTIIKVITPEGKEKILMSDNNYDIEDILYNDKKIYFISKKNLFFIDLTTDCIDKLKESIPLSGNNTKRKLFKIKDDIGIFIGSVTNSGISEDGTFDLPSFDAVLNGNNFGPKNDTAYCKAPGDKCTAGEKLKAQKIGNAAIYRINRKTKDFELFANGIRASLGIDTDEEGRVYAIFQGMEDKGVRPISSDRDYIYEVKEGKFYGFPDYSGGDYIESPRFQDDSLNLQKSILLNIPGNFDREAMPIYVSEKQNSLKCLAIDKKGSVFSKGSILFYDNHLKEIRIADNKGNINKAIKVSDKSNISDIAYLDDEVYILDSSLGYVYKISKKVADEKFCIPLSIWIYISLFAFVALIIVISKCIRGKK